MNFLLRLMMASSGLYAFGLGLKLSYVPQSLPNAIKDLSIDESNEVKLLLLNDYLLKCQEEMTFTGVFKQELPQSRSLLTDGWYFSFLAEFSFFFFSPLYRYLFIL